MNFFELYIISNAEDILDGNIGTYKFPNWK